MSKVLGRNYLKGTQGDQMNVMLSCAGHNLRLILRQLRVFCRQVLGIKSRLQAIGLHQAGAEPMVARIKQWIPQTMAHNLEQLSQLVAA